MSKTSAMSKTLRRVTATVLASLLTASPVLADPAVQNCPQNSPDSSWSNGTLQTGTTRSGVTFVPSPAHLELDHAGGLFKSTALGTGDYTQFTGVADFNKDGWDDFVGANQTAGSFLRIYENNTYQNPAPNWYAVPAQIRTPKFTITSTLYTGPAGTSQTQPVLAGDFNGDGWPDVFHALAVADDQSRPTVAEIYLNKGVNDVNGHAQFLAPYAAMNNTAPSATTPASLGYQVWSGSNMEAFDWNGDRKLDILVGSGENNGEIRVFTNQCTPAATGQPAAPALLKCADNPTFKWTATLITNLGYGTRVTGGLPTFSYYDFNGDGYPDLIVGAPVSSTVKYFPGKAGGLLDTANVKTIPSLGACTGVFAADYSQDGKLDIVIAHDGHQYNGSVVGGKSTYYINNGTGNPFSATYNQLLTDHGLDPDGAGPLVPLTDLDTGFVFDYDHDPKNTPDLMIADGNDSHSYVVLANRFIDTYVNCGDVASGVIPLGTLGSTEMTVTAARIHPSVSLNGGTVTYYLTNETPPNWVQASDCGDGSGDLCATFPKSAGRDVQWKATMCSNSSHTLTPQIVSMTAKFVYTTATEHYRSGVIVNDGVTYVGAFREPGDRGEFYAVNAGLNQTYWNAASKLDAMADSSRNLYTQDKQTGARLAFSHSGTTISNSLVSTLGAANGTQAISVVDWVRSARFGVGNTGIALSRLGAIETSTPGILTKPGLPTWYVFASKDQRTKVDQFLTAQANRKDLVIVGSKDGIVHAFRTLPTDITNTLNGQEAWGFVPTEIASSMVADYSNSLTGTLTISTYPDGSPTLADVADANGNMSTIAIVGAGNGGKSVAALDVTQTIDPSTNAVTGPTPLWHDVPGGSNAGNSQSKVAVARVRINNVTRFIAIAATGIDQSEAANPLQRGRIVYAYDVLTGAKLWQFQTKCPVTSDITVFETDDDLEPGHPTIDGYVDRAVFADRCGYVYKVDPAKDLGGAVNDNGTMGTINVDQVNGVQLKALFYTKTTPGALAAESPIVGTVGAQVESSTSRLVLFFGTGGLENWDPTTKNEFYAVYADNGAIRSKITGTCSGGHCEKFYGGVVVSESQVLLTRTVDPVIGSTSCDRGSSTIQAIELNQLDSQNQFITDFTKTVSSAVMGALYGDAGAIYFADLGGQVVSVGQPRTTVAGGDEAGSGSGTGTGTGTGTGGAAVNIDTPMTLVGWRQVF